MAARTASTASPLDRASAAGAPAAGFVPFDVSFGQGGVVEPPPGPVRSGQRLLVEPDGRIVVAGFAGEFPVDFGLRRLTPAGRPDVTFGTSGVAVIDAGPIPPHSTGLAVGRHQDGRILLAAACAHRNGNLPGIPKTLTVARVTPVGAPDASFSADGRLTVSFPDAQSVTPIAVLVRSDDRILIVAVGSRMVLTSLLQHDGQLDRTYGTEGKFAVPLPGGIPTNPPAVRSAVLDDQDRLQIAGTTTRADTGEDLFVARYLPDGRPDLSFGVQGSTIVDFGVGRDMCGGVAIDDARRIVLGAAVQTDLVTDPNGTPATRFGAGALRLLPDGQLDDTFGDDGRARIDIGPLGEFAFMHGVGLLPDGRIAIGGEYWEPDPDGRVVHMATVLSPDGTPDPRFDGHDGVVELPDPYRVASGEFIVQPDGKLLLYVQGDLIRLNSTTTFAALALTIGADQTTAGPGPLNIRVAVRNDGASTAGGILTLTTTKPVTLVDTDHAKVTIADNRRDVTAKLLSIPAGGSANVMLRTTVTGFEGAIELHGAVRGGAELNTTDNSAHLTVLTTRNATI